jgi:hypothetical protein
MSFIRDLQQTLRVRSVAKQYLAVLIKRGRPGGLDVSRLDAIDAAAVMWLQQHDPRLTVVKNRTRLTLMFKEDVDRAFGDAMARTMAREGVTSNPGEELHVERDEREPAEPA